MRLDQRLGRALNRRILCLWLPRLPTDRLQRRPAWQQRPDASAPLVLVAKLKGAERVVAIDDGAARVGLAVGMTLAEARAVAPGVLALPHEPERDAQLLEWIADWADRYTPMVGRDPPAGLFFDITGASHLAGGDGALVTDLLSRLERQGFAAAAAIAPTAGAAWAFVRARGRDGMSRVVPENIDLDAFDALLAPLAVHGLRLPTELVAGLARVGLKTIGDLMVRPRQAIAARFGDAVLRRLDQARGLTDEPITPRQPVPPVIAGHHFAEPVLTTDAIEMACGVLAARLAETLVERGQGAVAVELSVYRVDGAIRRVGVALAAPSRSAADITALLKLRLGALDDPLDPGFGYDLVRLAATSVARLETRALGLMRGLDGASDDDRIQHQALIDRLAARFGAERVGVLGHADTHIPERADFLIAVRQNARNSPTKSAPSSATEHEPVAPRPVRLFDPPEAVEVIASVPDGPPLSLRWRRQRLVVMHADGPERIAAEWWRARTLPDERATDRNDACADRDYWRIEDQTGTRLWVFRQGLYGAAGGSEGLTARWFVHGVFA